jgi:hypothetical protein
MPRCQSFAQKCVFLSLKLWRTKTSSVVNSGSSLFCHDFWNSYSLQCCRLFWLGEGELSYHGPRDSRCGCTCSSGIFTYIFVLHSLVQLMALEPSFNWILWSGVTIAHIGYVSQSKFWGIVVCFFLGNGSLFAWNSMLTIEDYYVTLFPVRAWLWSSLDGLTEISVL